jgi:transcriptional regulator with XRE-family HTH domain
VVGIDVRHLGEYIREQRAASDISLRQLAKLAGVSNPYLSQIERGLRKPSAEILQQIAKALRISAEALYVQAGILEHREGSGQVADAVLTDDGLNERQKQVLLEIYDAFRKENAAAAPAAPAGRGRRLAGHRHLHLAGRRPEHEPRAGCSRRRGRRRSSVTEPAPPARRPPSRDGPQGRRQRGPQGRRSGPQAAKVPGTAQPTPSSAGDEPTTGTA